MNHRLYDLEEATERSRVCRRSIDDAESKGLHAGCYACCTIFPSSEVLEFLEAPERAICPRCGVDAVLLDDPGYPVNSKMLAAARRHHFW